MTPMVELARSNPVDVRAKTLLPCALEHPSIALPRLETAMEEPIRNSFERAVRMQLDATVQVFTGPTRTLSSDAIFLGEREIGIEHQGSLYRLKITRQGKLILNK